MVQLIVLNIASSVHVFPPTLFTILVVMALVATTLTVPMLNWLKNRQGEYVKPRPCAG